MTQFYPLFLLFRGGSAWSWAVYTTASVVVCASLPVRCDPLPLTLRVWVPLRSVCACLLRPWLIRSWLIRPWLLPFRTTLLLGLLWCTLLRCRSIRCCCVSVRAVPVLAASAAAAALVVGVPLLPLRIRGCRRSGCGRLRSRSRCFSLRFCLRRFGRNRNRQRLAGLREQRIVKLS